ncbi:hypothetical protein LTR51_008849 [Lithohypha guttulata]|nr:hypothetical protein LTR51_008849 [Lithohypha guttulata]
MDLTIDPPQSILALKGCWAPMTDRTMETEQVVVRFFREKTCYNLQNKKTPVTIDLKKMRPITRREDVKEERVVNVDAQWSMDLFAAVEFDRVRLGWNIFGYEQLIRVVIKDAISGP